MPFPAWIEQGFSSMIAFDQTAFVEKILFLMGQRADVIRILTEKGSGSVALSSEAMTNQKFSVSVKDRDVINHPSFATRAAGGSNDNSNTGRSF